MFLCQNYFQAICNKPVEGVLTRETFATETCEFCGESRVQSGVFKVYSKSLFNWDKIILKYYFSKKFKKSHFNNFKILLTVPFFFDSSLSSMAVSKNLFPHLNPFYAMLI